jgi:hypothetical protein
MKEEEILDKLRELIDVMEEHWGDLEGFEVRLEHSIVEGQRQTFANLKEVNIFQLTKTSIEI